jgi:hypothetical protein
MTTNHLKTITEYLDRLRDLDRESHCYLEHGTNRPTRPLTDTERERAEHFIRTHELQQKQCWRNAQLIALTYPKFTYGEGYVCSDNVPIPIHHAWVEADETVWELTIPERPEIPENGVYFGITVPDTELRTILNQRDTATSLVTELSFDSTQGV